MVRVRRIVMADSAVPRISAGSANCFRFCSGLSVKATKFTCGDQPHQIDGNTITIVPIQKLGTASIRIENERVR